MFLPAAQKVYPTVRETGEAYWETQISVDGPCAGIWRPKAAWGSDRLVKRAKQGGPAPNV